MNDKELQPWLLRMKEGNKESFQVIFSHTSPHIYRTVYFLANHKQDVEDIVSEVYLEMFRSLSSYNIDKPFRSWLNGLIIRQVHNWHRKLWRKFRIFQKNKLLEIDEPPQDVEGKIVSNENTKELLDIVDSLSYKLREVIVLRYYQENSFEEIASLLNIPLGTVKSRHHLAIRKLRDLKGYTKNEGKEASIYVS